jgi:hypothetical protein
MVFTLLAIATATLNQYLCNDLHFNETIDAIDLATNTELYYTNGAGTEMCGMLLFIVIEVLVYLFVFF